MKIYFCQNLIIKIYLIIHKTVFIVFISFQFIIINRYKVIRFNKNDLKLY